MPCWRAESLPGRSSAADAWVQRPCLQLCLAFLPLCVLQALEGEESVHTIPAAGWQASATSASTMYIGRSGHLTALPGKHKW
jgi:hypothetical protein